MTSADYSNLKTRVQRQQKKKIRKIRFYHSFLTIVLLICVCEISYSALMNLAKIVVYQTKIVKAQQLKAQAETRNKHLKNEIQNFSSMYKVESIARNNLKMAAKDEVLIIINLQNFWNLLLQNSHRMMIKYLINYYFINLSVFCSF